jgi:hypothetical protein
MTSTISLVLFLATFLTCPLLLAQDATQTTEARKAESLKVTPEALQPWELKYNARFARAFQYQLGLQEQPGTATIQNGSTVQFIPNPEHYLVKHSLTFQFSELFLTSSDFGNALKTFSDLNPGKRLNLAELCGGKKSALKPALNCVASPGPWWQRAISGVTMQFSLSERTRVASGIVVPAGPFPSDYDKAGEIDFDPTKIFILGTNWKDAATGLAEVTLDPGQEPADKDCFRRGSKANDRPDAKACTKNHGGSKGGLVGVLAVAVPTFKYLRQTQFDFLKNGGVLTPSPFPEPALNNYTFTWDLRRLIAPAKERVAVADAIKTYNAGPKNQNGTKLCVTISNGQKSYMPISDNFPENSCKLFAEQMSEGQFQLACVVKGGQVIFGDKEGNRPPGNACEWADSPRAAQVNILQ